MPTKKKPQPKPKTKKKVEKKIPTAKERKDLETTFILLAQQLGFQKMTIQYGNELTLELTVPKP